MSSSSLSGEMTSGALKGASRETLMSGDYSRVRFDPKNDFAAVLMQQGRVQLDADWNELVALLDRRWRAETVDIIGKGTVPKETPDGFRIQIAAGGLTIGRGRIYVDGLLAENHGKAPWSSMPCSPSSAVPWPCLTTNNRIFPMSV